MCRKSCAVVLEDMPSGLVMSGEDQELRRDRVRQGQYRTWRVVPRFGTAVSDRWTVIGSPVPGAGNDAADWEDGQYPCLAAAYEALECAENSDDGTHEEG